MMNAMKQKPGTEKTANRRGPIRLLLAAGGTGGHVYPAISIADQVHALSPASDILFVGTRDRMEWQAVPKAGFKIKSVWISGFHRRLTPKNLLFPLKLIVSLLQSIRILRQFKPDIVLSCGGFAAGPIGWTAGKMGIPIVIQEQNSYPGVTNRLLSKKAEKIFTAFKAAKEFMPANKITLTGNPVRKGLAVQDREKSLRHFSFTAQKPVLLVLGGSGGARALNNALQKAIGRLHDDLGIQIIWQCGKKYYSNLSSEIDLKRFENLRLFDYIDEMPAAYGAADLVLTRAGAGTCSELMLIGKPSILVPSPNVAGDHQSRNAESMTDNGASVQITEKDLDQSLVDTVEALIFDREILGRMSQAAKDLAKPDAAEQIAAQIFEIAEQKINHE